MTQQTTNKMKLTSVTILLAVSFSGFASVNTKKLSKQEYVEQWKATAIEQMEEFRIPASITMAQAILESANGNSELARKANNHFGIKCHGWKGKKMYKDDDKKDDCFRVYKSAKQSFEDHSDFLTRYNRYAFLFDYKIDDYKSWAKGLKKAGYATNPKYPRLLIDLIEDLNLDDLDKMQLPVILPEPQIVDVIAEKNSSSTKKKTQRIANVHKNGVKYVVAKKGDTFYSIAKEFDLTLAQMYRYNDFSFKKDYLENGDIVYLQAKKRAKLFKKEEIVVKEDISINELSQMYAVKAKSIRRLNDITSNDDVIIAKGEKITLR